MKTRSTGTWVALLVLAAGVFAGLMAQRVERDRLEAETLALRLTHAEAIQLQTKTAALKHEQPGADELANLRRDHDAVERLRNEVETLKAATGQPGRKPAMAADGKSGGSVKKAEPGILDTIVPESAWRNVGYATPASTIETALWAAAGGDVELLAKSFILEGSAREKAVALRAGLPAETRARYATPELLVAYLTARDVPLGGARIIDLPPASGESEIRILGVQLRDDAGTIRQAHPTLRETADGWRLVVPEATVEKYAEALRGAGS